ncbi:N-acylglucosamine-6-phosphate 2-epimerase [Bacillus mesophilus]|uniref:Putative N-acetylmannosamine-6-phosphate 2-epimerase n=1 Tax=Bacillus mesophilus TaxID=1808955 RepID=A0A6M0Q828_9BACI|nr:N-acetylmannosamine-6-phosphate 2-epimerase [Bacillus mesophilus]MBM7661765.1 N-acylglucosamine-6-phosphate 2-epimerase [Bacillus mesophilus]NEY72423.1 N-acetylmannosamine-6-phosphate 2-epimerase [Bacillus mesophilus]
MNDNKNFFSNVKGGLIVSCQALEDEPLHGSTVMAKMALAAQMGGAVGIRANGPEDIAEITKTVDLPVVGLIKRDYTDSPVYITPTKKEVDELLGVDVAMIALDATKRERPNGESLEALVSYIHSKGRLVMADISTYEEGVYAQEIGCDCVSTTLSGYTPYSPQTQDPDFTLIQELVKKLTIPVFAEGRISTPEKASTALSLGAHTVVVGSAITRPQNITKDFVNFILKDGQEHDKHNTAKPKQIRRVN